MAIEQYLADLLVPKKWEGKTITPVLAQTMGDGKLLAKVTPIGSRPESWYILIDSSYLSMSESKQDEYQDEIHQQIEGDFGRKWLTDCDKRDKEEMKSWTKLEKKNGYKDYPAYEWDGGSIEILNVNEFVQEMLISELLKIGYQLSSEVAKYGNYTGVKYTKNEIEFHLFDDWFIVILGSENNTYNVSYKNCECGNLMQFIANEILENRGIYILDVPKNIYDFKYLHETHLPFSHYEITTLFEGFLHVQTKAKNNYLAVRIADSTYLLIDCEITDIKAVKVSSNNKELFISTLKDIITAYDNCIVCKFKDNEFTKTFKINSILAIQYL
jgi:hypothetical protein